MFLARTSTKQAFAGGGNTPLLRFALAGILLCLSSLVSFSCGKKSGKEDNVVISMIPSKPVVINADWDFPDPNLEDDVDQSLAVTAPWFKFKYSIKNNSNDTVTVVALTMNYRSSFKGAPVKGTVTFSGTDLGSSKSYLGEVAPGGVDTPNVAFFADSLPQADGFIYHVEVVVDGWFGTADSPRERFTKTVRFSTQ